MSYTIKQLADLAGVSVRTLHFYDESGLLKPNRTKNNGYRVYEKPELLKLQQILFFRELDFPVKEIKRIMTAPNFDIDAALRDQKRLIELKKERLNKLIKTINKTINDKNMKDQELYDSFDDAKMKEYAAEAKERWGNTEAYKQSQERYAQMSKEDIAKIQKDSDDLMKEIAACINDDVKSEKVQRLIDRHFNNLNYFYEPSLEIYRGLANMYVEDPRFTAFYEKYTSGLARFMRDAMIAYCDNKS